MLQHSATALSDILMQHGRGYLLPFLEDWRSLGTESLMTQWRMRCEGTSRAFAAAPLNLKSKEAALEQFVEILRDSCKVEGKEFHPELYLNRMSEDVSRREGVLAAIRRYLRGCPDWTAEFSALQKEFRESSLEWHFLEASEIFDFIEAPGPSTMKPVWWVKLKSADDLRKAVAEAGE